MGSYHPSKSERKAMLWCIDRHIKIAPWAVHGKNQWRITIQKGRSKMHTSKETWGPDEIWEQIYAYYLYYYNKRDEAE